ncbi:MAG: hypothetical protein GVY04_21775 [Cyanobacteria bacterium]|jgi:hypothetical protein|nr:hypothetical protein [Cyanobacteria bacterium GSL.Bin1]
MSYFAGMSAIRPYETTHARIPKEIKPLVDRITTNYRELYDQPEAMAHMLSSLILILDNNKPVNDFNKVELTQEEAIELAKKLLKAKKSKKQTIEKLLTGIYGGEFDLTI